MVSYGIKAVVPFKDITTGKLISVGETITTTSRSRVTNIMKQGLGELVFARHEKKGPIVLIHQILLYKIGGVETANRELAKAFPDFNLTFLYEQADQTQLLETSKFASVLLDDKKQEYNCDVLILTNYDTNPSILRRVKAEKVYQAVHTDWAAYTKICHIKWEPNKRIDKFISVSETAKEGLKEAIGVESTVCRNVLNPPDEEAKPLTLLALSRATVEKGIDKLIKFCDRLDSLEKDYVLFLCSTVDEQLNEPNRSMIKRNKRIIVIPPSPYVKVLLKSADYLIQLSLVESYCYSVREALQQKVPVLVSDIPAFREVVKEGENGYFIEDNIDSEKIKQICEEIPTPGPYTEEIDKNWINVFKGEL